MRLEPYDRSGRARRYTTPLVELNIVPLVDVTLVLLIIFMATTAFVTDQKQTDQKPKPETPETARELPLNLPSASLSAESPPADLFILSVDKVGKKYIGSEPVSLTTLHQRVRDVAAKSPRPRVRIDADKDTRFQDVLEVVDLCQFEGLRNVGIHTAPQK